MQRTEAVHDMKEHINPVILYIYCGTQITTKLATFLQVKHSVY